MQDLEVRSMAYIKLNDPKVFNEFWESMAASVKLIGHTNEEKHFHNADKADLTEATKGLHSPALKILKNN